MTMAPAITAENAQNEHTSVPKNIKRMKFPRDSLIVHIPLNVTADLGVAMKRVRAKRLAKYKKLQPHLYETKTNESTSLPVEDDRSQQSSNESDEDGDSQDKGEKKNNVSMMDTIGSEVRREHFSSMVDYLEAKYARGVMIHDLDERIREKKKLNKDKDGDGNGKSDDLSVLSESEAGSCYSDDSGDFIDDGDLRTDVAHQILASSAFGTTKIEADAMKAQGKDDDSMCADDHAFFVNVGDLEMEDGWDEEIEEDQDWLNSLKKSKGKKRKRSTKDGTSAKGATKDKKSAKKAKPLEDKDKKSDEKKKIKTKTKKEATTKKDSTAKKEASTNSAKKEDKSKSSTPATKDSKKSGSEKSVKIKKEDLAKIEEAKKAAVTLKRKVDRLYKKCVEEIEKMTEENLPRKPKKGGTAKCHVTVPEGKSGGDELVISNPHILGQRLKVNIPSNRKAGDKFPVTVPLPEVRGSGNSENKFTKECIDALDKYSHYYDDWCQVEAKYRDIAPKKKGAEFKIGVERLKKFDKMLSVFPKNMEIPVDPPFLRLLVRRKRQNQNKRNKKAELEAKLEAATPKKAPAKKEMKIKIPQAGKRFPTIKYKKSDFAATKG